MDRGQILETFYNLCRMGRLENVIVPTMYFGNLFRMRDFRIEQYCGEMCVLVNQDEYTGNCWRDCNDERVPLMEYATDYLQALYRSLGDKIVINKNLF